MERFASKEWQEAEKLWQEGKITSKECLDIQMSLVNITKKDLEEFLHSIKMDESFFAFLDYVKSNLNAKVYIVSDGFRLFIKKILGDYKNKVDGIYANYLYFINNKFKTLYRYSKNDCNLGVCKCDLVQKLKTDTNIYVGDGVSDFCAIKHADFVFAKGKLLNFLKAQNVSNFTSFSYFEDIINQLPFVLEKLYEERGYTGYRKRSVFLG
ncbi:MtnX-like HAD-IB family phosphatase [Hydrogenobaculum acidophilum]